MRACRWSVKEDEEQGEPKGVVVESRSSREAKLALGVWQTAAVLLSAGVVHRQDVSRQA